MAARSENSRTIVRHSLNAVAAPLTRQQIPGASQSATGQRSGHPPIVHDRNSVYEDVADSRRDLRRILVCRAVDDRVRIEYGDVGEHSGFEQAAIVDADA